METGKGWVLKLDNRRMQQIIFMFSNITGKEYDEAKQIILQTDTGKAIKRESLTVLYEQQTENLYSIAMELSEKNQFAKMAQSFSIDNIAKSLKELSAVEKQEKTEKAAGIPNIKRQPAFKSQKRKQLLQARSNVLRIKKQNQMNDRRIENADKFKG